MKVRIETQEYKEEIIPATTRRIPVTKSAVDFNEQDALAELIRMFHDPAVTTFTFTKVVDVPGEVK